MSAPDRDGLYAGIPDTTYHADQSTLSSSGARKLLAPSTPAAFRHSQLNGPTYARHFDVGHVAHELVLGEGSGFVVLDPAVHGLDSKGNVSAKPASTATWKAAVEKARADGLTPISKADHDAAQAMTLVVHQHPTAARLLDLPGHAELSGYWTDPETGARLRYRPDYLATSGDRVICVDYKTAVSAHPATFARHAGQYGYHQQAAWYLDGLTAHGFTNPEFLFVVQEKTAPYQVAVMRLDDADITAGRDRNRQAIRLWADCTATGTWPSYPNRIHHINIPTYMTRTTEGDTE